MADKRLFAFHVVSHRASLSIVCSLTVVGIQPQFGDRLHSLTGGHNELTTSSRRSVTSTFGLARDDDVQNIALLVPVDLQGPCPVATAHTDTNRVDRVPRDRDVDGATMPDPQTGTGGKVGIDIEAPPGAGHAPRA